MSWFACEQPGVEDTRLIIKIRMFLGLVITKCIFLFLTGVETEPESCVSVCVCVCVDLFVTIVLTIPTFSSSEQREKFYIQSIYNLLETSKLF